MGNCLFTLAPIIVGKTIISFKSQDPKFMSYKSGRLVRILRIDKKNGLEVWIGMVS